jgi:hypothetical protein
MVNPALHGTVGDCLDRVYPKKPGDQNCATNEMTPTFQL